jgi:transglutaminase-like putative cysteine protease
MRGVVFALMACAVWLAPLSAALGSPAAVVVWPSASSFEALEDSPLDVRYTAVNEGPGALDNAVLELPQPAGFVRAEPPAMQWQGRLVWGIGPLLAGDQYTVRVLVEPPKAANAVAAGTLRGTVMGRAISVPVRGVSLDVPAGVGEYLLATPDADPTDPPVALAAAREAGGSDPLEPLFRFVRDEVRLVPSRGSLLGARGALYEGAANATDKANLLVALLRAQGIPAGYRRGVLSVADATARFSAIFPPLSAQDLSGVTLTPALLRADLEATLALVPAAALLQLGATRASRLAALAALADAELMALVAETTTPSAGELAALRDHTWVEAFVNGTWVALDPSLPSNGVGTAPAVESAPQARTAAIPEGVRHRVVVRVARESYEPAWGQGPTLENPSMELAFGAGDLVGRSLAAFHRLQIDTTMGFFFFSQTTRYTPTVEVRDLERRDRVEVSSGEVFEEFTSNFGGNLTDSFVTAVFVEVELLEPGQSPGQGKRFVRALADRFDAAMRAGAGGGIEGNLAIPSLDVLDAAAFTISAARAPGRLAEASQALLTAVATEAEGEAQALEAMPGADPPPSDALARARGFASQLTETLSLLYEANLGARLRLLGQTKRQLPYSREPRVVAVAARVPGTGDPAVLSVDLMHETTASVGAPGQPRRDRRAFASAYGLAATDIESALLESVVGPEVVSTGRVFAAALDAEVPFVLLQGTSGVNALASDAYALSAEARFRMLAALEAGSAILAPTASSLVNGTLRAAWYEIGSDGSIIGKLDDGSGGVAIEYALNLYSFACATALKCPKNQYTYTANISKFTGYLWGLITSSLDAAFACSFGAQKICEKLTTKFAEVPGKVLALAGEALQLQGWGIETGFDCVYPFDGVPCGDVLIPPCVAVDILIEGYCNFIAGFAEADKMVKAALADPLLTGLPGGAVDPNPTPPGARHLAETTLQSLAVLSPANVSATVSAASVRAVGPVEVQSPSAAVALRARKIALGDAVVTAEAPATAPSGASDLEWRGIDLHVPVLGAADASWTGVAALDAVSSAGSLRVGATFGEPTTGDEESLGAVQLGGGVSALFDTLSASAQAAGELVVGGGALVAGRYGVGADGLAAAAMCVTAASEAEVVVAAPDAVVTLTLAVGSLQVGGFVVSAGESVSLRSPAGSVALVPTSPASDALAASLSFPSAQWSRLALGQPSPGVGPFVIPVAVQSTQAEPYTVRAAADAGWQLEFQDGALVAVPPAGLPSGPAPIAIEAIGLSGARASATLTLDVQVPAQPTPSVAIVEDPRYSTDLLGWRTSALQVEVRHAGPAPAEYALAVQVDPPLFAVDVAQTSVWVEPGGVRRVGLALRVPEGTAMLPPAGATVVVRATVSGPATAFGEWAWEMPPVSSFVLAAEPRVVALAPGSETEVVVRLRSTGNVPAPVGLSVDAPSALEVAIAPVGAPVQPGAEVSTTAVVKALALGQSLPRSHMLRVQRPATPFEQERGLTPPAATVQVAVVAPGGEALALALAEAQGAGQPAVATALALALDAHTRASQACDDAALATLAAAFGTLEAALMGNPATAAAAEAVQAAQVALDGTGCAGLVDLAGLLAPVGEVALLPDLVVGVAGPATVQNGAPVPLSINVLNAGGAPSVATEVELFLRKGSSRTLLHVAPVGALGTGQGLELPFVFDSSALLGSAVLEATVDGAGLLAEVSETNNIGVDVLEVLPKGNAPSTNAPPEFLNFPGSPVQAGTPFEFAPEVVDPDGDVVSLDLIAKPKGLSFDGTTLGGTFSTPGELTLHWVAMDVWGALTEQKMPITVVPPGFSNAPPLFTGPSAAAVVVGVPLELKFEAFDPEGGAVEFALVTGPEGAQLEPAGANAVSLTFVPTAQQVGSHVVSLRATDALGAWVARAIAVRVNAEPAGPNLRLGAVSAAAVTWLSSGTRDGALELEVANTGDAPAAATALRVWEEGDDEPGFGPGDTLVATAPVPALPRRRCSWTSTHPTP